MEDDHLPLMEMQAERQVLFVQRDTAEWDYMWDRLAKHYVNADQPQPTVCYNADCGEAWQYMGTIRRAHLLFHEFRHRCHPVGGQREYLRLQASERLAVLGDRLIECE
jgi:hypothetical protein